jgi:hypothetical protein
MEKEYAVIIMETNMMEIGKIIKGMEKEYTIILTETNMKEIGKMIK